ncbi:MAG TPA: hypothetical protein VFJ90_03755 [Candidatus Didemnitutus sp.]|nr:hypothetical protein [Candidatus Didemnitutus sp.]
MPQFKRYVIILGFLFAAFAARLAATTVVAPSFDQLVAQADYVVRAVVKSVNSEWRTEGENKHIITKVELDVREVMKGNPPQPLVLELLGGRIGNVEMKVEGAPTFFVGDEDILFVRGNGQQVYPLVAIMHGQYLVQRDAKTGQEKVLRANGVPLYSENDVALPMTRTNAKAQTTGQPLTPAEFSKRIQAKASNQPVTNAR